MNKREEIVVSGRITFPPGRRPDSAARVVARVEDTSRADAPSVTVAEQVQEDVPLPSDGDPSLPFAVHVPTTAVDPRSRYVVRVHVDVTGTQSVTAGDYVSTKSYPVLTAPKEQIVEVMPV